MENVDKTIDIICEWIQKEINDTTVNTTAVSDMTNALAELVRARALEG